VNNANQRQSTQGNGNKGKAQQDDATQTIFLTWFTPTSSKLG